MPIRELSGPPLDPTEIRHSRAQSLITLSGERGNRQAHSKCRSVLLDPMGDIAQIGQSVRLGFRDLTSAHRPMPQCAELFLEPQQGQARETTAGRRAMRERAAAPR